jgi:membrane protease subunit HflC
MISGAQQIAEKYAATENTKPPLFATTWINRSTSSSPTANAQAAALVAQGEQEYMQRLAAAYDSTEKQAFYEFMLALDALAASLDGTDKTVILGPESPLPRRC